MPPVPSFTPTWHTTSYPSISPTKPSLSASGKAILITGGGSGIGARTARSFAQADAAHIALMGRREKNLQDTASAIQSEFPSTQVYALAADVTEEEDVKKAMTNFIEKIGGGKINVFVNNAGHAIFEGPIASAAWSNFSSVMDVNVKGSFVVTQAFLQHAASDAVIVNVASLVNFLNLAKGAASYCVSKAAGIRFFDLVQDEWPGLRVVNIQPGAVETDMSRKSGLNLPDDVSLPADFMVWLASPEAGFTKGKYVFANWDVEEMKKRKDDIENSDLLTMTIQGWPFGGK